MPTLLPYKKIQVNIPRRFIFKCIAVDKITTKDKRKTVQKLKEIEQALNRLRNAQTVVERIQTKHFPESAK